MASTGGGKMRPKRSHGANKPYQRTRPKSFLDRVKDLVTPSWLSNMWTSSTSPEDPPNQQHSIKQPTSSANSIFPRQSASPGNQYFNPIEVDSEQEPGPILLQMGEQRVVGQDEKELTTPVIRPFAGVSVPVSTSTPVDVDEEVDEEVIEIDAGEGPSTQKDDGSEYSAPVSVVSSLYPNLDKFEHQQKLSDPNLDVLSDLGHRSTSRPSSSGLWSHTPSGRPATTRARPASPFNRPQQPAISTRRPSFNTSYFGTPRGSIKTSMESSSSSPFYPGRTTYGGSSSLRTSTSKRPRTSPYEVHLPIKRSVRPRLAKSANESDMGVTSNTAKRILDTLEKMSTPLSDAKRIPLSPSSTPLAFTASRTPRPRPTSSQQRSVGLIHSSVRIPGPPVSGLNTPHTISIAPNRQPPVATSTKRREETVLPSTSTQLLQKETIFPKSNVTVSTPAFTGFSDKTNMQASSSSKQPVPSRVDTTPVQTSLPMSHKSSSGGKMKNPKRSSMHYSSNRNDDEDLIEVPDLPNIALPLGNFKSLPSFNFGKPLLPSKKTTLAPPAPVSSKDFNFVTSTPAVSAPAAEKDREQEFTFASPILRQSTSTISAPDIETTEAFTFSLPKKADSIPSKPLNFVKRSSSSLTPPSSSSAKSSVKSSPLDTKDEDEEESGGFGIRPAKTLKTGSCLEVFGIVQSSESSTTTTKTTSSSNETIAAFAEKFKPPPGSWECSTCLIQNKANDRKCIACQSSKPQAVNSNSNVIPPTTTNSSSSSSSSAINDLRARFKPPEGSWECPTCMIQNKQDTAKCVACMTANPVSSQTVAPVTNNSLMDKFRPPPGSWECDTCLVQNKADAVKCVACTTSKPGAAGMNTPLTSSNTTLTNSTIKSWQCSSCPVKNDADFLKCKGCGLVKPASNSSISTSSLMAKFRPPPGSWTCDTCLIQNQESTERCIACETPKPGSQPSLKTPPTSVFKFGSQSSASSTVGDLKFGGTTTSVNFGSSVTGFNIPSGGVTFGSQNADLGAFVSQKSSSASGFPSGSKSEGKTNSLPAADSVQFGSVKTSKTEGGFTFGAPTSSGSSAIQEDKPAANASFQFGAPTTKTATAPPNMDPFKSTEPSKTTFGTAGLEVNATPTLTQETDSKTQPKAAFSFSANNAESSTINFGGTVTEQKQTSAPNTTFTFGAKTSTDSNPPKSQSAFNFSASSNPPSLESQQSTEKAGFKFGATSSDTKDAAKPASSSAGFSFGGTANAVNATQPPPHQNSVPPAYQFGQSNAGSDEAGTGGPPAKRGMTFNQTSAPETKASFSFGGTPVPTATQQATAFVFGGSDNKVDSQSKPNGGMTFGTPNQSATSQPIEPFTFGAAANPAKPGGFNFSASSNQTTAPATGGFQFGATATSTTKPAHENAPPAYGAAFGSSTPTSTTAFGSAFGAQPNTNSTTNPFGGQQPSQAVAPTFGASSGSGVFSSVATPAFGTVASAENSRSSTPTFGATGGSAAPGFGSVGTSMSAFGTGAVNSGIGLQAEAAQSFTFGGSNPPSTAPGVFAFGGANNSTSQSTAAAQPAATGGFSFGQQQQQQQPAGFGMQGASQNATGATGFTFGGTQAPASGNNFSLGVAGSGRKIRKAVRRTRKT